MGQNGVTTSTLKWFYSQQQPASIIYFDAFAFQMAYNTTTGAEEIKLRSITGQNILVQGCWYYYNVYTPSGYNTNNISGQTVGSGWWVMWTGASDNFPGCSWNHLGNPPVPYNNANYRMFYFQDATNNRVYRLNVFQYGNALIERIF